MDKKIALCIDHACRIVCRVIFSFQSETTGFIRLKMKAVYMLHMKCRKQLLPPEALKCLTEI